MTTTDVDLKHDDVPPAPDDFGVSDDPDVCEDLCVIAISVVNNGPAKVDYAVVVDGTTFPNSASISPGQDGLLKLADFEGLQSGAVFTSRIIVPSTGSTNIDGAKLTYASNATLRAIYSVTGTAKVPVLNFEGFENN